jgi:acetyl-CoA C-acetyltransferase
MTDIGILGTAQVILGKQVLETGYEDLVFEVAQAALLDAGVSRRDVDTVVLAASDQVDGRAISSMGAAGPAGGDGKNVLKVPESGGHALALAATMIRGGMSDSVLVVAWGAPSITDLAVVTDLEADPFLESELYLNWIVRAATEAGIYRAQFGLSDEDSAQIAAKRRRAAGHSENTTVDEVLASDLLAWPLRRGEVAPIVDSACAVLVGYVDQAARRRPVKLCGEGWASDPAYLGYRSMHDRSGLQAAARRAYDQAGITDPADEVEIWEITGPTPYHEAAAQAALLGTAAEACSIEGKVNRTGGSFAANSPVCSGLLRVVAAAEQLWSITEPGVAVAHAAQGLPGYAHAVFVLSTDR